MTFCKDILSLIISNNKIWPFSVLKGSGHPEVFPVHHWIKCWIWFIKFVNKTGWSTNLYSLYIYDSTKMVFQWLLQTIKCEHFQCCKVQATLRCSQFITVQSVIWYIKIVNKTCWSTNLYSLEFYTSRLQFHSKIMVSQLINTLLKTYFIHLVYMFANFW